VTIDRENIANNRFFNYGAMLFPTNDGFFANDDPQAIEVFDEDGNFLGADFTITGDDALDSGREVNDEDPLNVIYELDAIGKSVDENGIIKSFPGYLPPGENGALDYQVDGEAVFANADFTTPNYSIANISITEVDGLDELDAGGEFGAIDFEQGNLAAGTMISDQFEGVKFSTLSEFGLMLFDSQNPTGDDFDLGATDLGKVLIISEDGNSSNPDDNAAGGMIRLDFENPIQVDSLGLLDIEEAGGSITFYDQNAAIIDTVEIVGAGDNLPQELTFDLENVASLEINLAGSGALTELNFSDV
jgi:hypothetical protein